MNSQLYIFVIWQRSLNKKDIILEDIDKNYIIREIYEIQWDKSQFIKNLKRFYGYSLNNASQKQMLCGNGSFLLILITDKNENLQKLILDDINEVEINSNIYHSKMKYRKWVGEDFSVHASNSKKESNHDLILLLGKNSNELQKTLPSKWDRKIKKIESNLIGNDEWKDLREFFDVLNNTCNYVVLRNFQKLPNQVIHHDIDILTDDVKNLSNILNEKKLSPGKSLVKIGNEKILLDFRFQEGHHYDEKWAKDILSRRELNSNGIYVPNNEDYFYSLLYHSTKPKQFRDEYRDELIKISKDVILKDNFEEILTNFEQSKKFVSTYMKDKGYHKMTLERRMLYKLKHSECFRLIKTAIFLKNTYGVKFLLKKIKIKINT